MQSLDWGRKGNQWEWNDKVTADNYQSLGYDAYSNGSDVNSTYKSESGNWVKLGAGENSWSYTSDPNKDGAPSDLEGYRAWRDNPNYHKGESWFDKFARNVNSSHINIMQDEGSGGGLMWGGYGKAPSLASQISAEAELQGFKSLNSGINPATVTEYFEQMSNGTFNKPVGVAGFKWEGKFFFNDGNHRMGAAIQYKIKTGSYKYMDMLMNNAKFDNANPTNYGKVYKFPVKPTK